MPRTNEEKSLDIFKDLFEAKVLYKIFNEDNSRTKIENIEEAGIIKIVSKTQAVFILIFDKEDLIIPKLILPYQSIVAIEPMIENEEELEQEEEELEDDFDLQEQTKASVIMNENTQEPLDIDTRVSQGTESMGEIEFNSENQRKEPEI